MEILKSNFSDSKVAKNLNMGRTKITSIVKNAMGPHFKDKLVKKLLKSKFSIMVDETTDISSEKTMCIIVRYYDNEERQIVSRFLDLVNIYSDHTVNTVSQGGTAENLFNCIVITLDKYKIPKENVIGFASDGCNTMMGAHNSVASRFKDVFPGRNLSNNNNSLSVREKLYDFIRYPIKYYFNYFLLLGTLDFVVTDSLH